MTSMQYDSATNAMSLHELPDDCLHSIAQHVVACDILHPVCFRAREAAQLATVSKAFRDFTNNYLYPALSSQHCPPALPDWPYPELGDWNNAQLVVPRLTIQKLKPILRATGCKVSGKKAELVERVLQKCPKAGKAALHRLQTETQRQLSAPMSFELLKDYKLSWDDISGAIKPGNWCLGFRDILNAARAKYPTLADFQQAPNPLVPERHMCSCGEFHSESESDDSDDMMDDMYGMYGDYDEFYDTEDEEMLDAGFMHNFMTSTFPHPMFGGHMPFPY